MDLFIRPVYKHILIDSLKFCQKNKGLNIHAWVLMTSHLHAIISRGGDTAIQDIIRDFKKHTSKKIIEALKEHPESRKEFLLKHFEYAALRIKRGVNYKVWQDGFHPVELNTNKMIEQRLDYIHNNPVEEEIVINQEDYKYSSAMDYAGTKGELELILLN